MDTPRIVYLVHDSPGRLRFRLSWLRDDASDAPRLAGELSDLPGVDQVEVRPYTGSVLITYDPARTDRATLIHALCSAVSVQDVTLPGQETPAQIRQILHGSYREGSDLAKAAVKAFQGINVDFLFMTRGRVSLGALTSLSLWAGAAARIVSSGRIALPDWHQLLWWGFRSFSELEEEAIETARAHTLEELRGK